MIWSWSAAAYPASPRHGSTSARRRARRILILENNDDFGGHARRNEFVASNGKTIIGYGGSQSLQTPSYFSPLVKDVLADIGVQYEKFEDYYDTDWHEDRGLGDAVLFRKEDWGMAEDVLVVTAETGRRLGARDAAQRHAPRPT